MTQIQRAIYNVTSNNLLTKNVSADILQPQYDVKQKRWASMALNEIE